MRTLLIIWKGVEGSGGEGGRGGGTPANKAGSGGVVWDFKAAHFAHDAVCAHGGWRVVCRVTLGALVLERVEYVNAPAFLTSKGAAHYRLRNFSQSGCSFR